MTRRLAELVVRRRVWVVVIWIAVTVAALPFSGRVEHELNAAAEVRGSEAMAVDRSLATRFNSPFALFAVLVASGVPSPDSPKGRIALEELVKAVDSVAGVTRTYSYLDIADTLFLAAKRDGTFLIAGIDKSAGRPEDRIPVLREATARAGDALRARYPDAKLRWTGNIPINFDLRKTSAVETTAAEVRVLPVTLILLLAAFGALVAAVLPLVAAGLAIVIALAAAVMINQHWALSILIQNMVSMIGLGVGIDYALLTISRFREARASGLDPSGAAVAAAQHAGGTIALSGATVMIGFAALTLVPLNELQSVGVGGLLVVAVAVLVASTLLPALLSWLGHRVDAGRIRLPGKRKRASRNLWRRWGAWVVAHPWLVLAVAGAPTLLLALQALRIRPELPRGALDAADNGVGSGSRRSRANAPRRHRQRAARSCRISAGDQRVRDRRLGGDAKAQRGIPARPASGEGAIDHDYHPVGGSRPEGSSRSSRRPRSSHSSRPTGE